MTLETATNVSGEIVSLTDAMRELGVWDSDEESRVQTYLSAAHAYCEEWCEITLHESVSRTYATHDWPPDGWALGRPPVTAVSSITYYDSDNAQQTLPTSSYRVFIGRDGLASVELTDTFERPALFDRQDAVTVSYTTGWGEAADAPPQAKAAILLTLKAIYGEDDTRQLSYARESAMLLMTGIAAWCYR